MGWNTSIMSGHINCFLCGSKKIEIFCINPLLTQWFCCPNCGIGGEGVIRRIGLSNQLIVIRCELVSEFRGLELDEYTDLWKILYRINKIEEGIHDVSMDDLSRRCVLFIEGE